MISSALGSTFSGFLSDSILNGNLFGQKIIGDINHDISQEKVTSYGMTFSGDKDPIFGSLRSGDIASTIARSIGQEGLFNSIFSVIGNSALNAFNVLGDVAQTFFGGISSFGNLIAGPNGLLGGLNNFVGSIFGRNAQENLVGKGGFGGLLGQAPANDQTLYNGKKADIYFIDDNNGLIFDNDSHLIGALRDGSYQMGDFSYNADGNFGLWDGETYSQLSDDLNFFGKVHEGQYTDIKIKGPANEEILKIDPEKKNAPIYIKGPSQNNSTGSFDFWNAVFSMLPYGLSIALGNGTAYSAQLTTGGPSPVSHSPNQHILYGLVNGIANKEPDPNTPPDYIQNLESDLVTQSGWTLTQGADFVKSALYQPWQFLHLGPLDFNLAKDIVRVIIEMQAKEWISSIKVMSDFDYYFAYSANDRLRPMVDVGYSGGFVPLVKAIYERKYNAETVVALGAATSLLFGIPADARDAILALIQQGAFGLALQAVQLYLGTQQSRLPNLAGSSVKRIINVYGTADILNQIGIGGKRDNLCGVRTINIEIAGATHFDYMRRSGETNPIKEAFNLKVSKFVTDLTLASNNDDKLNAFLQQSMVAPDPDGVWRFYP